LIRTPRQRTHVPRFLRSAQRRQPTIATLTLKVTPMSAPPEALRPDDSARAGHAARAYWRANLRYLAVLLSIWFAVSYGAGILFAPQLDALRIPGTGFPLGFWFAQQGSIYVFVVLIFVYVHLMNRLDRRWGFDEDDAR
jgi:putative solute:sodium symporter small subunit